MKGTTCTRMDIDDEMSFHRSGHDKHNKHTNARRQPRYLVHGKKKKERRKKEKKGRKPYCFITEKEGRTTRKVREAHLIASAPKNSTTTTTAKKKNENMKTPEELEKMSKVCDY